MNFAIVVLGVHDNNEVCRDADAPAEWSRGHHYLHSTCKTKKQTRSPWLNLNRPSWRGRAGMSHTRVKELLHDLAFSCRQALMQVANAVGQSLFQSGILYFVQKWSKVFLSAMQKPTGKTDFIFITPTPAASQFFIYRPNLSLITDLWGTTSAAQKVRMSMAVRRVCLREGTNTTTGLEGECFMMAWYTGLAIDRRRVWVWLTLKPYTNQQLNGESGARRHLRSSYFVPGTFTDLDVQLKRNRPDIGVEVEGCSGAAAQPVGHVFGVG